MKTKPSIIALIILIFITGGFLGIGWTVQNYSGFLIAAIRILTFIIVYIIAFLAIYFWLEIKQNE